jgi:hypothetical protein
MPGPDRAASSSVARPISAAVGITPSADARNTQVAPAWVNSSTTATGINGTSRYGQPSPLNRKVVDRGAGSADMAQCGRAARTTSTCSNPTTSITERRPRGAGGFPS